MIVEDYLSAKLIIYCQNRVEYNSFCDTVQTYLGVQIEEDKEDRKIIESGEPFYVLHYLSEYSVLIFKHFSTAFLFAATENGGEEITVSEFCKEVKKEVEEKWFPIGSLIIYDEWDSLSDTDNIIYEVKSYHYGNDEVAGVSLKTGREFKFDIEDVRPFT